VALATSFSDFAAYMAQNPEILNHGT